MGAGDGDLTPSEQMAMILEFVEESAADGTLVGNGPGNSADGRLGAMMNKLEAAGALIDAEKWEDACGQLRSAYVRTDGVSPVPDFVAGDGAPELADMLMDLMADLGCE
jgi:hypothetical protein